MVLLQYPSKSSDAILYVFYLTSVFEVLTMELKKILERIRVAGTSGARAQKRQFCFMRVYTSCHTTLADNGGNDYPIITDE